MNTKSHANSTAKSSTQLSPGLAAGVTTESIQRQVRWMTYLMFFVFAMTTDAVGVIIPQVMADYQLSMFQASAFHYVPMVAIGLAGLLLGRLADKLGRKKLIIAGLLLYSLSCYAFIAGDSALFFILLMGLCGLAIGIFKTAALALIGDISRDSHSHTRTMNTVEGFFALGAIAGPALVTLMIAASIHWKQLYLLAGLLCTVLVIIAARMPYPPYQASAEQVSLRQSMRLLKDRYAMGFSLAIALYVSCEVAIFVWLPTLLADYSGRFALLALHAVTIFFILRALGRFLASLILRHFCWSSVMAVFTALIFLCFALSMLLGRDWALWLMPLSGLFMSMIYPTLNSKGISCFPRQQHGAVAGLILAFTALVAAVAPALMALLGDLAGDVVAGFYLATVFAALLAALMLYNWLAQPAKAQLEKMSS
ncbi:MFS transporter [Alkalimonas amylolytica]|uniref:Fucose permease n=1 Tax=Alkalimonas amylolytica TaxID=152573 RepID=A0A1H3ZG58_ALKAM|nr:Fucose permease [Alkalimonas amylolytica]